MAAVQCLADVRQSSLVTAMSSQVGFETFAIALLWYPCSDSSTFNLQLWSTWPSWVLASLIVVDIGVIDHRGYWRHWSPWILVSLVIVGIDVIGHRGY